MAFKLKNFIFYIISNHFGYNINVKRILLTN